MRRRSFVALTSLNAAAFLIVAAGCSSHASSGGSGGGSGETDPGATAIASSAICATPTASGPPVEGCAPGPGTAHRITAADFMSFAARRWILCDVGHGWSAMPNEQGFDLHADGTFEFLSDVDAGDSSAILSGVASIPYSTPDVIQLDVTLPSGATYIGMINLTDSPRMMVVNNNGAVVHYIPADITGWPDNAGAQPGGGRGPRPAACDAALGAPHTFATSDELTTELAQTWLLCSDGGIGTDQRKDVAGLLLQTDGAANVLVWNAANELAIASDVNSVGTWSTAEGSPSQIDVTMQNGLMWIMAPSRFYDSPVTWTGGRPDTGIDADAVCRADVSVCAVT